MPNGKDFLIIGLPKKILLYKMSYFSELYTNKNKPGVQLDLCNYTTESDLKKQQKLIKATSQFAKKC